MTATLQLFVDFIKKHVGQQRRQGATLRCPLVAIHHDSVRHHAGIQVATDQHQHSIILDSSGQPSHQHIVVHAVVRNVDGHGGVVPPAPGIDGYPSRRIPTNATCHQLTEHGLAAFPLLELIGAQTVTDPVVEFTHPLGR